jgi:hypothetical protein
MTYAVIAVERAMKIQEVILRAMSGALTWLQAADILGMHPRSLRRVDERQLGRLGVDERGRERSSKAAGGGFHGGRFSEGAWPIIIALEGSRSAKAYRALAGLRAPHASFRRL